MLCDFLFMSQTAFSLIYQCILNNDIPINMFHKFESRLKARVFGISALLLSKGLSDNFETRLAPKKKKLGPLENMIALAL